MKLRQITRLVFYALFVFGIVFSLFASRFSALIESGYSTKLYYWTIRPYSLLTGLFPFSVSELIVVSIVGFIMYKVVRTIVILNRNPKCFIKELPKKAVRLLLTLAVLYLAFNLMWGFNYNRMTFAEISGLPVESASVEELAELAIHLTHWANDLREQVAEDERGVMTLPNGIRDMFGRANLGYERAAEIYPELGGQYGRPKGVMLSPYWSYTGIGGVFFPFTAEANINTNMPHFMLASTTTHEMAHQRGFAREDEANYIAYLTSTLHPDPDFQYSGVMLALTYTMNTLYRYNPETWIEVRNEYSEGVNRDIEDMKKYWTHYQGPIDQISTNINNTYLMANRQKDGVNSYGRMVDLMLAEFRGASIED
ncbi:MAG: hypothetical protein APF76_11305 [Desulfitibacter sp. BRH_c19]|nr:MAG: hypothetical protein APF76_11305 [Desulfitibacter sp. BRH_c19]